MGDVQDPEPFEYVADEPKEEILDPFSPENCPKLSLIVQMRIYDATMALLSATDKQAADAINEIHERGGVVYSIPFINLGEDTED